MKTYRQEATCACKRTGLTRVCMPTLAKLLHGENTRLAMHCALVSGTRLDRSHRRAAKHRCAMLSARGASRTTWRGRCSAGHDAPTLQEREREMDSPLHSTFMTLGNTPSVSQRAYHGMHVAYIHTVRLCLTSKQAETARRSVHLQQIAFMQEACNCIW